MKVYENTQGFLDDVRNGDFKTFLFRFQDLLKEMNAYLECIRDDMHDDCRMREIFITARYYSSACGKLCQDFRVRSLDYEKAHKNGSLNELPSLPKSRRKRPKKERVKLEIKDQHYECYRKI